MRQSAQEMPATRARSSGWRSVCAELPLANQTPTGIVQLGPRSDELVRLKLSEKSTPLAAMTGLVATNATTASAIMIAPHRRNLRTPPPRGPTRGGTEFVCIAGDD